MDALGRGDMVQPLRDFAQSGKPFVGICLGFQLMMTESTEFGRHRGLGIIEGEVLRLEESNDEARRLKIPHVGWSQIFPVDSGKSSEQWGESLLDGIAGGEFMYFVHSFYAAPNDSAVIYSTTLHGKNRFCSSVSRGNIFGCQFHPERSGPQGLRVYRNLAALITSSKTPQKKEGV